MGEDMFSFEEKMYYEMFENRVTLAVIAANPSNTNETRFLTSKGDIISLPYKPLRKGSRSRDIAKSLFSELTGLDPTAWTLIQQTGFVDTQEDYQIVLYSMMIPECVALVDDTVEWVSFEELINDHMRRGENRPTAFDLFSFASHTIPLGSYQ